jgi:hypothetical protein
MLLNFSKDFIATRPSARRGEWSCAVDEVKQYPELKAGPGSYADYTPLIYLSFSYASLGSSSVPLSYLGYLGSLGRLSSKSYDEQQSRRTQHSMGGV